MAGAEAAAQLAANGIRVCLIEKEPEAGGNVKNWAKLFPDFAVAQDVRGRVFGQLNHPGIELHAGTAIATLHESQGRWTAEDEHGQRYEADAVLLASGFTPFDAGRKEELGHGIYGNIITSVEYEQAILTGRLLTTEGQVPRRVAFLNCVGSRDEKVGNNYCSRVCCINAVKQAIEYKELVPDGEAYVFYMDLRMSGQCYEELYRRAQQEFSVNFIRGRISEASGTIDHRVQLKAEDTLTGLPLRITVDLFVLMVGMEPSAGTKRLASQCGIAGEYGFARAAGTFTADNLTGRPGLFLAGTCKRPLTIPETLADARSAALQIMEYLK